jgi:glycosyltransferase involved in cell wall biosynthesis
MLSTVIPVYNEDESLRALHAELSEVAAAKGFELDIIFIDDGSSDDSWRVINELAQGDLRVRGIRFRTNFGKAAALSAGFKMARGELVMTLDADLQDDPHEIPRFLEKIHGGLDVVSGYKQVRHDPWHKVYPSRVFNWLVSWMTGVKLHDHNCGMKCYRREIFDEVRLYGELHRFVPVLAAARGYKVGELVINHRARKFGHSKYGVRRFVKGFLDLLTVKFLTNFGQRPQHLLGTIGLLSFAGGLLGMFYLAAVWVFQYFFPEGATPLHQRPALLYSACAFLFGGQILSIGLLAEMLTAYYGRDSDVYSIAATTDSTLATPANAPNHTAASPNDPAL